MALVVTGSSANAYDTISGVGAYLTARNDTTWAALEVAEKEATIIEATQYVDAMFRDRFPGRIQATSQRLEWPRIGAYDRSGRYLTGIPQAVKDAVAELALAAMSGPLVPVAKSDGRIKRTRLSVGSYTKEIEYDGAAPEGRDYRFAEKVLEQVLTSSGKRLVRT